jgi:tetratricopeptide (TPR) repeat protein
MKKVYCYASVVALFLAVGCSGGGGGGGPDPSPPKITSGPSVTGIDAREANVRWTTDKNATSIVFFGPTSSYTDSLKASALVLNHSVALSELTPAAVYHYEVASDDADGRRVSSGDRTFTTLAPTSELLDAGWGFFESAEFDSALVRFEDAYSYEPGNPDVLEALGWTLLRLYTFEDGGSLSARSVLEAALALEPDRLDCLVALAFVYQAIEAYEDAIRTAQDALALAGAGYIFGHDPEISTSDIRYCLILSLTATGDFTGALAEAQLINPAIDIDPGDAATWNGYSSFEEAVIMMVEGLRDSV